MMNMKSTIIFFLLLAISLPVLADDCQDLKWERNYIDSHEIQYYGSVKPGTAKTIFVEVWGRDGMTGTGLTIVNPRGRFSVYAQSSRKLSMKKSTSRAIFSCSMDSYLNPANQ